MLQLHGRGESADAHVGMFIIIIPKPPYGNILYFLNVLKKMLIKPVVAHCPIISFNIAVLLRLARLNVCQADAFAFSPSL